jgi:DNA repair exonuclease SbcCD ATPase subunit
MKASHEDMGEQLTSFACTNLAEARKLLGQRNSLEQQVKDEQVALEEQLDEYESLDDLRAEVKRLGQQAKTQVTKLKATAEELAADLDLLHDQKETQRQDLRRAETAKNKADQDVLKAEEKLKVPQAEYSKLEKQQHQVEIDRAQFTADKEGIEKRCSDGLDLAKRNAAGKVAVTEAKLEQEKAKLPDDIESLESKLSRADKAAKDTEAELNREQQELYKLDGSIRGRGGTGLYSEKAALAESHARHAATAERELTQARAARLMFALLDHHKRESIAGITGPLEEELHRGFSTITGRTDRRVFLDENLGIRGIGRDEDQLLAFEQLSQGAKEQLLLCLRGAVAMKLADTEPHVLILDDALVNTDGVRQDRVLQYLETLADRLQVIVLTCHGERYRGVGRKIEFTYPAEG